MARSTHLRLPVVDDEHLALHPSSLGSEGPYKRGVGHSQQRGNAAHHIRVAHHDALIVVQRHAGLLELHIA